MMPSTTATATLWLVTFSHKHNGERTSHRAYFMTSDPTGAGLYEVVRQAAKPECRQDIIIHETSRQGDVSGVVTLVPAEVN
jgi:hypothetical protein